MAAGSWLKVVDHLLIRSIAIIYQTHIIIARFPKCEMDASHGSKIFISKPTVRQRRVDEAWSFEVITL
jgi:hypothetical protein